MALNTDSARADDSCYWDLNNREYYNWLGWLAQYHSRRAVAARGTVPSPGAPGVPLRHGLPGLFAPGGREFVVEAPVKRKPLTGWYTTPEWDVELHERLQPLSWEFAVWAAELGGFRRWRWRRVTRRMRKGR